MHLDQAGFWWKNLKERGYLEFFSIGVRMNLNYTHGTLQFYYSTIYGQLLSELPFLRLSCLNLV
jgi:hypothetical protein